MGPAGLGGQLVQPLQICQLHFKRRLMLKTKLIHLRNFIRDRIFKFLDRLNSFFNLISRFSVYSFSSCMLF